MSNSDDSSVDTVKVDQRSLREYVAEKILEQLRQSVALRNKVSAPSPDVACTRREHPCQARDEP